MWLQIDEDQNNKMSYTEFCKFFSIEPDEYANRVFLIMNTSLTGVVNLAEFLTFCYVYLIVDKKMTQQLAFRMLSRKSGL
jgi:Ca2+-binding EF-hand superfamily protein